MPRDFFQDYESADDTIDNEVYKHQISKQKQVRKKAKQKDVINEVGVAPPPTPEMLEQRQVYLNDFILMHKEVYPESTGVRPFGKAQQNSILMGQDIFHHGGRLLKLEPRGYAKTTRITNEVLYAILCGIQDYIVIVCSNVTKAHEIIDSMITELYENDKLMELFPGTIACFRQLDNTTSRARYQTYGGSPTYIRQTAHCLRLPYLEGEPSSGKWIEVRPLTNLKGLTHKVKKGPDAGRVYRPTLVLFDDPQTHEDALSPGVVKGIVGKIKRDALKGGSHSKPVSAIMAITPVCSGDVAYHFEKEEHSWQIVKYKMLEKFPDAHDIWMSEYADIYKKYDRTIRGDRGKALLASCEYVKKNWDMLHAGANVTWEHAYAWDTNPQIEISPVQHAYNIILDDGMEDFEYEYQCNTEYGQYTDGETIHATPKQILTKVSTLPRKKVWQKTQKVVTHIDINMNILTYVTIASTNPFEPHIIDYGTYPKQPGLFSKRNLIVPLRSLYPNISDYREVLYLATLDLIEKLSNQPYLREDNIQIFNSSIGVDMKYEEDYIARACRESPYRNLITPCWGVFVSPDEEALHERKYPDGTRVYHNCVVRPNTDRTLDYLHFDTNFFKTECHKAWNKELGVKGSLSMFAAEWVDQHKPIADHCNIERPERKAGNRTNRTRICWVEKMHQADNEYFDNIVNCFALLMSQGIDIEPTNKQVKVTTKEKEFDMQAFMNQQKGKKLM